MFSSRILQTIVLSSTLSVLVLALPKPLIVDKFGKVLSSPSRSICGKDEMVPMTQETIDIKKMGTAIGIWNVQMPGGGTGKCTGTLISKDLFLTAAHCDGDCSGISVTFGYLSDGRQESFQCKEIVEKGTEDSLDKDYLVIRLQGNPGVNWGWYDVWRGGEGGTAIDDDSSPRGHPDESVDEFKMPGFCGRSRFH